MISQDEQLPKENVCGDGRKESNFYWTRDLVAEFAHEVALSYKNADLWSGDDLSAEKGMADAFIKRKKYEAASRDMIISDAGQTLIVDKKKLEEVIKFLFNYRNDY